MNITKVLLQRSFYILLLFLTACEMPNITQNEPKQEEPTIDRIVLEYPVAFQEKNVIDTLLGRPFAAPFRWLQKPAGDSTVAWLEKQDQLNNSFFSAFPFYDKFITQLQGHWSYERFGLPEYHGEYYYITHNTGLQNQDQLYRARSLKDTLTLVFDPNMIAANGEWLCTGYSFSRDGQFLAYELSQFGGLWKEIHILNLETGKTLPYKVEGVSCKSIAWYKHGFFYSRFPEQTATSLNADKYQFQQLLYHQLGSSQEKDELVFTDRSSSKSMIEPQTDDEERFLILSIAENTFGNALLVKDLTEEESGFVPINTNLDFKFDLVDVEARRLLLKTNQGANQGRLIQLSPDAPDLKYWEEIIPATSNYLEAVYHYGDYFFAHYLEEAVSKVVVYDEEGKEIRKLSLPGYGYLSGFSQGQSKDEIFFSYSTLLSPDIIYRLRLNDFSTAIYRQSPIDFPLGDYEVKKRSFESYDGTQIPMFIIQKKEQVLSGKTPLLLMSSGGLNQSLWPRWNADGLMLIPAFLENGGAVAIVNNRGSKDLGLPWHKAGAGPNKERAFDDLLAATAYLIANKYTNEEKLCLYGKAAGGLGVGVVLTQRPDLFKVALLNDPFLDMINYPNYTNNWFWEKELGACTDTTNCDRISAFSPLQQIEHLPYPATFVATAMNNNKTLPYQSYELVAKLQAAQKAENPILLRASKNENIGPFKSTDQRIRLAADMLSFVTYNLNVVAN